MYTLLSIKQIEVSIILRICCDERSNDMSTNENLFLKSLRPIDYGDLDGEEFEPYFNRVSSIAPNIPKTVLFDWFYRHFDSVDYRYSSLNFEKMEFIKEEWSTEDVYRLINTDKNHDLDELGFHLYEQTSNTQRYVIEHRTWPDPIIVLENKEGQHSTYDGVLGKPFHLLEGHLRMSYFRRLYKEERDTLPKSHFIWKVTIND